MKSALAFLALAVLPAGGPALAAQKAALEVFVSTSADTPGSRMLRLSLAGAGVEEIAFEGNPVLTGDSVASADPVVSPGGRGEVRLVLTPEGSRALAGASSRSVRKRLGVVVDGRLLAAPYVLAPLRDGVLVIAGLSLAEAQALAPRLGPPALAVRIAESGPPDARVLAAVEGTWSVKGATLEGRPVPDKKFLESRWAFHGGTLALTNGAETGRFTVATDRVDPLAPLGFRLDPVPPSPQKPIWMIFRREENRLILAFFDGRAEQPADFSPETKKVVVELELSRGR